MLALIAFFALPVVTFGVAAWAPSLWTYIKRRGREELLMLISLGALVLAALVLFGIAGDSNSPGYNDALGNTGGGLLVLLMVLGELSAVRLRPRLFATPTPDTHRLR